MARGTGTKRDISPDRISKLIRGDKEALQRQAAIGGNQQGKTAQSEATTAAMNNSHPNGNASVPPEDIRAELAKSEAAEKAFKDYLQGKMDKAAFETEEAMEKAKQEAWERYVRGQQSAHAAATSASNPTNAEQAKKNPKSGEPEGAEAKEAKESKPWWESSGGGPSFIFGRNTAGAAVNPAGAGELAGREEVSNAGAMELLKRKQARAAAKANPPPQTPPQK